MPRPALAVAAAATAVLLLSACTGTDDAPPTSPTASTTTIPTPTPTPTPEALLVAGGERAPVVAGGDCDAITDVASFNVATGLTVDSVMRRDPLYTVIADNVGALVCDFAGPSGGGRVQVFPADGFVDTGVTIADAPDPDRCVNACEWSYADDEVLIVGYVYPVDIGLDGARAAGAVLGPQIADAVARQDDPRWRRDTTRWWPARDCTAVAAAVSELTGVALSGRPGEFYGGPGVTAADIAATAARRAACLLDEGPTDDADGIEVVFTSGTAWSLPYNPTAETQPYDPGVAGITGFTTPSSSSRTADFQLTDGVNVVSVAFWPERDDAAAVVQAIARVAADG